MDKLVTLVELHWVGHHPTYFAQCVLALEELGATVIAICPFPNEARATVAQMRANRDLSPEPQHQTTYLQVVIHKKRMQRIRPSRISSIDWTIRHFRYIEGQAKEVGRKIGREVDLVFYTCITDWEFEWLRWAESFLSLPWSGLYLQALSLRMPGNVIPKTGRLPCPKTIFRGSLCRSVAILDEGMKNQFSDILGKPVVAFPDMTDEHLPFSSNQRALENRLRRFANGRPVVGLFGLLQKSKGVLQLAKIAQDPRMTDVCFAFGGDVRWSSFSTKEIGFLSDVLTSNENIWTHLLRLPDEAQLNSVLSACDVIYAAYLDFPHSSNIMAKAALLHKPIVVSDGYLMAERVRKFNTGVVVPPDDIDAQLDAINQISSAPEAWAATHQPDWSGYLREHSYERLKEAFFETLSLS